MRLMTYNIRAGVGMDDQLSLDRTLDTITKASPDILCIQEVDQKVSRSNLVDQAQWLADRLSMKPVFQGNLKLDSGLYGIAVLSSYEIQDIKEHHLPSQDEPRGALEVCLNTPEGQLTVICTHWGLESSERELQAEEVAKHVNVISGPLLVCGDFNEEINDPAVSLLLSRCSLRDVCPECPPTFDSANPTQRLDLILASPHIATSNVYVEDSLSSDHKPVVADFSIL